MKDIVLSCSCGENFSMRLNSVDGDLDLYHGTVLISWVSGYFFEDASTWEISRALLRKAKEVQDCWNPSTDLQQYETSPCGFGWRRV